MHHTQQRRLFELADGLRKKCLKRPGVKKPFNKRPPLISLRDTTFESARDLFEFETYLMIQNLKLIKLYLGVFQFD